MGASHDSTKSGRAATSEFNFVEVPVCLLFSASATAESLPDDGEITPLTVYGLLGCFAVPPLLWISRMRSASALSSLSTSVSKEVSSSLAAVLCPISTSMLSAVSSRPRVQCLCLRTGALYDILVIRNTEADTASFDCDRHPPGLDDSTRDHTNCNPSAVVRTEQFSQPTSPTSARP